MWLVLVRLSIKDGKVKVCFGSSWDKKGDEGGVGEANKWLTSKSEGLGGLFIGLGVEGPPAIGAFIVGASIGCMETYAPGIVWSPCPSTWTSSTPLSTSTCTCTSRSGSNRTSSTTLTIITSSASIYTMGSSVPSDSRLTSTPCII